MPSTLALVFGADEFRVSAKARELLDELAPAALGELAREVIEADASAGDQAAAALDNCTAALQTSGLFAAEKTVLLKGATFLGTDPVSKSDLVKTRMGRFVAMLKKGLPPGQSLLVTAPSVDKRSAFYNVCKTAGKIHEFAVAGKTYLAEQDAKAFAAACLKQEGVRMAAGALDDFVMAVGVDSRSIANEAEKLSRFLGEERTARPEDVAAVTSTARDAMGWDLADAVGGRDLGKALAVMHRLLAQREKPMSLVGAVARRIDDLLLLREAINRRWVSRGRSARGGNEAQWTELPPEAARMYGEDLAKRDPRKEHPYRAYLLAVQAGGFSASELETCRRAVLDAYRELVTGSREPAGVIEVMLVRMLGAGTAKIDA